MIDINKYIRKLELIGVKEFEAKSFLFDLQNDLNNNKSFDLIKYYSKLKASGVKDDEAKLLLNEIQKETGSKAQLSFFNSMKLKFEDHEERKKLLFYGFCLVGAWWLFNVYFG